MREVTSSALLILFFLATPRLSPAQLRSTDFKYYGSAQVIVPTVPGGFRESYNLGFGAGFGLGIQVTSDLDFRTFGAYRRIGFDAEGGTDTQGALYLRTFSLSLQHFLGRGGLRPYLIGTFGWDAYDFRTFSGRAGGAYFADHDETAFSLAGGFGVLKPLSYTAAFFSEASIATRSPQANPRTTSRSRSVSCSESFSASSLRLQ